MLQKRKQPPQRDWEAEVVKDLLLFGPGVEFFFLECTLSWSGEVTEFCEDPFFFGIHLISAEKTVLISVKTFFFGDHLILTEKPLQTDENLGQVCLLLFSPLKKAPPLRNPGYAPDRIRGQNLNLNHNFFLISFAFRMRLVKAA